LRLVAGFEGHSIDNPLGAFVPSELTVMICHTLRTVTGVFEASSRSLRSLLARTFSGSGQTFTVWEA
jgi:hypothetical protein